MKLGQITEAKVYSYINARIKARKGQLLSAADYERLLTSSLNEGLMYLQDSPRYSDTFTNLDPTSSNFTRNLENLLDESLYSEIITLIKDTPKKAREFIEFYLKKSYVNALKQVIRRIHMKEIEEISIEDFFVATPEEKTELIVISKTESIEELIQKLQTPWVIQAMKSALTEYIHQESILLLENALDQAFYEQLWQGVIPKLDGRDKKVARKIIGMEIDLLNMNMILRGKVLNLSPQVISNQLIPINYRLGSTLAFAEQASSFSDAVDGLQDTVYSDLIRAINRDYKEKGNSLANMEQLQQEWFIQALLILLAGYPFHIGTFLSYIIFRLREIENIRIIFETKWKGIELKFARELLIYFK